MGELTPKQAADVIHYYHNGENADSRAKGWKNKISLARSALHATTPGQSILPDKTPLLTGSEMQAGLDLIENPPVVITPEQEAAIDRLVDTGQFSYDDAERRVLTK